MIHILDLHFQGHKETIGAFLVESSVGPLLFETGPYATWERLTAGLAKHGYKPEDVQHVFLTHIHLDHAGAAWAFARHGASIYLHPTGVPHLHDPSRLLESASRIYGDQMDRLWGELHPIEAENLKAVKHGTILELGGVQVQAWYTPGHAIHHIAWQIEDECICGDVAGVCIEGGIVVPPCPPPDIDIEAWQESIELLHSLKLSRLWLTHYGSVDAPAAHLKELEARLLERAEWMKPHFEAGRSTEEITPLFQAYSREELLSHGLQGAILQQYEHANPSWMSVAGLLRYWKKRS